MRRQKAAELQKERAGKGRGTSNDSSCANCTYHRSEAPDAIQLIALNKQKKKREGSGEHRNNE